MSLIAVVTGNSAIVRDLMCLEYLEKCYRKVSNGGQQRRFTSGRDSGTRPKHHSPVPVSEEQTVLCPITKPPPKLCRVSYIRIYRELAPNSSKPYLRPHLQIDQPSESNRQPPRRYFLERYCITSKLWLLLNSLAPSKAATLPSRPSTCVTSRKLWFPARMTPNRPKTTTSRSRSLLESSVLRLWRSAPLFTDVFEGDANPRSTQASSEASSNKHSLVQSAKTNHLSAMQEQGDLVSYFYCSRDRQALRDLYGSTKHLLS